MFELLQLIGMLYRFQPASHLCANDLQSIQDRRLRRLLRYAKAHSPYYARRFDGLDVAHCRLTDLPTLRKAGMMASFDEIVTDRRIQRAGIEGFVAEPHNLGKLYLGQYGISHTSGSQGQPALIVQDKTALMQTFAVQFSRGTRLSNRWAPHLHRLWNPARMAVVTQQPGFYPSGAAFGYLPPAAKPFFKVLHLSVFDPIGENVAKLNAFRPEFIVGYTSSLEQLAREELQGRLKLVETGALKQLTNISEPLPESAFRFLQEAFRVPVTNEYAMGECMCLSSGCVQSSSSHLNSDMAILEVVDRENRPVPPGKPGSKVLITNLYNLVQPFIRYEVDDIVTMSPAPCSCGSPFPLIASVTGRDKDKLWISINGAARDLPYYIFLAALHRELNLAEHQVLQTGVNTFVVRAAPQPGKSINAEGLRQLVAESVEAEGLGHDLKFDVEIVPDIERGPSGKAVRVKNLIGPPPN